MTILHLQYLLVFFPPTYAHQTALSDTSNASGRIQSKPHVTSVSTPARIFFSSQITAPCFSLRRAVLSYNWWPQRRSSKRVNRVPVRHNPKITIVVQYEYNYTLSHDFWSEENRNKMCWSHLYLHWAKSGKKWVAIILTHARSLFQILNTHGSRATFWRLLNRRFHRAECRIAWSPALWNLKRWNPKILRY